MGDRLSASDWCDVGLSLLREEGMHALTIERLCGALGRTKGSFYHHFRDLDAYLAALLVRWEKMLTDQPMIQAASEPDPQKRAARLGAVVAGLDHQLDLSIRAWALWDERAKGAMQRVDARRIGFLVNLHRRTGVKDAQRVAELDYVLFVGVQQVGAFGARGSTARLAENARWAVALLVAASKDSGGSDATTTRKRHKGRSVRGTKPGPAGNV